MDLAIIPRAGWRCCSLLLVFCLAQPLPAQEEAPPSAKGEYPNQFELLVVGPDDQPVPHAKVEIVGSSGFRDWPIRVGTSVRLEEDRHTTQADEHGKLVFGLPQPGPKYLTLAVETPGYAPYWAAWHSDEHRPVKIPQQFTIHLRAGKVIGGVIIDEEGHAVSGAEVFPGVSFESREGPDLEVVVSGCTTDAAGHWKYECVPAARESLHISIDHPKFQSTELSIDTKDFQLQPGELPKREIQLQRGATVAGRVVDSQGQPVKGAYVRALFLNEQRSAFADESGSYEIVGCRPEQVPVVVTTPRYAIDMQKVEIRPGMPPVDFQLEPGRTIRVRVLDPAGKPASKAWISLRKWRGEEAGEIFDSVKRSADAKGVWVWHQAPADLIVADIHARNGMELADQQLIARDQEYVFQTLPLLEVTAKVIDRDTKLPIPEFRVIPGTLLGQNRWHWVQHELFDGTGGAFEWKKNQGRGPRALKVEAAGYLPAISRDLKMDEGHVTLDFELRPEKNIVGEILTPDGHPASHAVMVLGLRGSQISLKNGEFDRQVFSEKVIADQMGRFQFGPQTQAYQLIVTHPEGFAEVKSMEGEVPEQITLQPWCRVEGTYRVGDAPARGIVLTLNHGFRESGDGHPHVFTEYETTTNELGQFNFDRVIPSYDGYIGRRLLVIVDDGAVDIGSSRQDHLEFPAGEVVNVELGGAGRAVVGQLHPPNAVENDVKWSFASANVWWQPRMPPPPFIPPEVQGDLQKARQWLQFWSTTPEGLAFTALQQQAEADVQRRPSFQLTIARDGHFRIDDVPEGDYQLSVRLQGPQFRGNLGQLNVSVHVPDGTPSDEPIDLGTLRLE